MNKQPIVSESLQIVSRNCTVCSENYESKSNKSLYCSSKCKLRAFRNKTESHGEASSSAYGENTIRDLVSSVADLRAQIQFLQTDVKEALERVEVLEEKDYQPMITAKRGSLGPISNLGPMNDKLKAVLESQKKVVFSPQQIRLFQAYDEARQKGGAQTDVGWEPFEDLPKPDRYDEYAV